MADTSKQMAEFARELWENYIKPKYIAEFSDNVTYYMATVVSNDGNNRVTIRRPFDDPYQVSCLEDMAGLVAGDTVLVLRFGNGTNNANHIIFGKGNGNTNYTAAEATELANAAIKTIEYGVGTSPTSHSDITSWSSDTPQWEEGKYIWQRTSTNDSTYTYTCIQGATGPAGAAGYNTATVYLYQRATSTPNKPTNNLTYTFSNGTLSGIIDNDWKKSIPVGTNPIYVIAATAFSDTDTDLITTSDWSSPVVLAQNGTNGSPGTNGINTATVYLYQRKATIPNKPSNTLTYTFATGALSGTIDNDWLTTIPSGTDPLFVTFATAASTTATDTIDPSEWVTPEILAENGEDGTSGQMLYATSSSAATTVNKTATLTSGTLTLEAGATVAVTFTNKNTAASPTLNVSSTGAKTIRAAGADLAATSAYNWTDGATVIFVYDGTYWQMDGTASLRKADDASKVATNYITDVTGGVSVAGNSATADVQITDKVRVQADSTHFTDVESDGMKVYAGNPAVPVATFLATGSRISSDNSHYTAFDANSWAIYGGTDSPNVIASSYPITSAQSTSSMAELSITNSARTDKLISLHTQKVTQSGNEIESARLIIRSSQSDGLSMGTQEQNGESIGGIFAVYGTEGVSLDCCATKRSYQGVVSSPGLIRLYYGDTPFVVAARFEAFTMYGTGSPGLSFYDTSGTLQSWYGTNDAFIKNTNRQGYVVHGQSATHKMTLDCDTSTGYVAFYADGAAIGAIPVGSSDRRTKTDIEPISDKYKRAVSKVELKDFKYDFSDSVLSGVNNLLRFGVIAQDVIDALESEGIRENENELIGTLSDENGERYIVNYVPFLIARIANDEDRIKELEEKNADLEARLAAIESKLGL